MVTAMQELKSDLILTKSRTKDSLSEIENQEIKDACIKVVEMTLNSIITRIDDELLKMEKYQIMSVYADGRISVISNKIIGYEEYYNETFRSE
jgi:acetamidase/formamidase